MGMIIVNGEEYASAPLNSFPPIIYSDEEREVGVWRDGKPLYQKTINFGAMPNSSSKNVAHNISNLGYVVKVYGVVVDGGGDFHPIPDVNKDNANYQIAIEVNSSNIRVITGYNRSAWETSYITLLYTKTTDVAGSGKYTTYGGLSHHYSENEQVVGTWIDGKPIYEKLYTFTSAIQINTDGTTVSDIVTTNMREIVSCKAIRTQNTSGSTKTPAVLYTEAVKNGDAIKLFHNPAFGGVDIVVIQYTKTTD